MSKRNNGNIKTHTDTPCATTLMFFFKEKPKQPRSSFNSTPKQSSGRQNACTCGQAKGNELQRVCPQFHMLPLMVSSVSVHRTSHARNHFFASTERRHQKWVRLRPLKKYMPKKHCYNTSRQTGESHLMEFWWKGKRGDPLQDPRRNSRTIYANQQLFVHHPEGRVSRIGPCSCSKGTFLRQKRHNLPEDVDEWRDFLLFSHQ